MKRIIATLLTVGLMALFGLASEAFAGGIHFSIGHGHGHHGGHHHGGHHYGGHHYGGHHYGGHHYGGHHYGGHHYGGHHYSHHYGHHGLSIGIGSYYPSYGYSAYYPRYRTRYRYYSAPCYSRGYFSQRNTTSAAQLVTTRNKSYQRPIPSNRPTTALVQTAKPRSVQANRIVPAAAPEAVVEPLPLLAAQSITLRSDEEAPWVVEDLPAALPVDVKQIAGSTPKH